MKPIKYYGLFFEGDQLDALKTEQIKLLLKFRVLCIAKSFKFKNQFVKKGVIW
jgi:hypothetical protein